MTDDVTEQREASRAEDLIDLGQLTMRSDREGEIHTIRLAGEVDLATADPVERELERVEQTDAASIVLDLSAVTFMDSTGVRLLVTAQARSRADANRLTLLRGGPQVQRVLQLSGVDELLPFAD
jgi:anti-sigma B factor antagonist